MQDLSIIYPNCWALLFGGHIEERETPELALIREIKEEINYDVVTFFQFNIYQNKNVIRHVFHFPLTKSTITSLIIVVVLSISFSVVNLPMPILNAPSINSSSKFIALKT